MLFFASFRDLLTVPGAVATGSLEPGRYRSRQYRAATRVIKRIARHRTLICNPR